MRVLIVKSKMNKRSNISNSSVLTRMSSSHETLNCKTCTYFTEASHRICSCMTRRWAMSKHKHGGLNRSVCERESDVASSCHVM
jgi:hypothetical protein